METKSRHLRPRLVAASAQAVILLAVMQRAGFVPRMRTVRATMQNTVRVFLWGAPRKGLCRGSANRAVLTHCVWQQGTGATTKISKNSVRTSVSHSQKPQGGGLVSSEAPGTQPPSILPHRLGLTVPTAPARLQESSRTVDNVQEEGYTVWAPMFSRSPLRSHWLEFHHTPIY